MPVACRANRSSTKIEPNATATTATRPKDRTRSTSSARSSSRNRRNDVTTLIPTKTTGATASPNPALYVDPAAAVTPDAVAAQLPLDEVNTLFLADLLSAVLTHERCGTHLYRSVAGRSNNPVLKRRY